MKKKLFQSKHYIEHTGRNQPVVVRKIILLLVVLFLNTSLFAFGLMGNGSIVNHVQQQQMNVAGKWILDKTVSNVDFYHMVSECNGNTVVYLKFINKNSYNVNVSWKEDFVTRQVAKKTESDFGKKQLVLAPGETAQNSCTVIKYKECVITPEQVSLTHKADILEFDFKEITVSKAS